MKSYWDTQRREPYTEAGIRRLTCIRCGGAARVQWQICSDDSNHRPLCTECDVALNKLVLEWMGHPRVSELMQKYERSKR